MAYNVRKLVTKAFYLSGVTSRKLETVQGDQLYQGMDLLDLLLSEKSFDVTLLPYFKEYEFNAVSGQEKYFVPNLAYAETLTFNIGPVRYSTMPRSRKRYFGTGRIDNVETLPFSWHYERVKGGSDVYLYFVPDVSYPIKIWGKFMLDQIPIGANNLPNPDFDLSTVYDSFYLEYLRYGLAEMICSEYNITFLPQSQKRMIEMEKKISDLSPQDYSVRKMSTLQSRSGSNWGDVNLGRGWRP